MTIFSFYLNASTVLINMTITWKKEKSHKLQMEKILCTVKSSHYFVCGKKVWLLFKAHTGNSNRLLNYRAITVLTWIHSNVIHVWSIPFDASYLLTISLNKISKCRLAIVYCTIVQWPKCIKYGTLFKWFYSTHMKTLFFNQKIAGKQHLCPCVSVTF